MQRIEEYNQLLEDSKEVLRKDTTLWKGFLKFATQFTHYQFFDQILIYVQNPKATACATFDQWKKIGRYVRKGEHSIVLLDETGKRGKLRHIFDVTATGPDQEFEYRPKPILPEQREELARKLNAAYSRENSAYAADSARWDGDLEHTLSQIALSMTQEYYNVSAQKTPAVRKNVRGMNAPITNNATIIPIGFSSGIVGFSWPDVLQNAVIRCIALLFQEKHFR